MTIQVRRILIPIDFSDHVAPVLEWAAHLAKEHDSRAILLHAYHLPVEFQQLEGAYLPDDFWTHVKAETEQALARFAEELGRDFTGFSEAAMDALQRYGWPGNIRELKNAVERSAILADQGLIRPEHLNLPRREAPEAPLEGSNLPLEGWTLKGMEESLIRRALVEFNGNRSLVARELGINRTTLYNKLRVYGIEEA